MNKQGEESKLIKTIRQHEKWAKEAIKKCNSDDALYWFEEYRNGVELLIARRG